MPLLDRNGWKADAYRRDDPAAEAVPVELDVIVPLDLLAAALAARQLGQRLGVDVPNVTAAEALAPLQDQLDLVAIAFPKFSDGRGFSLARMMRQQGFAGTLRATGPIIPDQFAFALQCGFDEVELSDAQAERQPIEQWLHALDIVDVSYQDGATSPSIFAQRRAAR